MATSYEKSPDGFGRSGVFSVRCPPRGEVTRRLWPPASTKRLNDSNFAQSQSMTQVRSPERQLPGIRVFNSMGPVSFKTGAPASLSVEPCSNCFHIQSQEFNSFRKRFQHCSALKIHSVTITVSSSDSSKKLWSVQVRGNTHRSPKRVIRGHKSA